MNVAILGCGVGGLSAGIALKTAGFDVAIYERTRQMTEIGAGIVCWPNASFVLEQLGVLDKVAEVSAPLNDMKRLSNTGEFLGSLDINALNRHMQFPSYAIIRQDLMRILLEQAMAFNIKIHYQHEVTELQHNHCNTTVLFSHGARIQPDIIIGADGRMRSVARQYVHGNHKPVYQGFINWIGIFEHASADFSEFSVSDYWGVGERFGIVPVAKTKAYWAGGVVAKNIEAINPSQYKAELNAIFSDWPDPIAQIIDETPLSRINKIYVHDHDPITCWHKNNVVLLGDAAHAALPTSGQGACQALEDAWHLSQCLKDNMSDIHKAFTLFTELRVAKTAQIMMGGRQLAASIFNQDVEFCRQRNLASQHTNYQNTVIGMARAWSAGLPMM